VGFVVEAASSGSAICRSGRSPSRGSRSYTGKYRIEGNDFITTVDVSWNEIWNGTEQRRHDTIEGDKLFIESAPAPSILFPGRTDFRRIVWEREK